ncbi:MAG: hypothetical protein WA666_09065 [Nitrospirota bacterium]
MKFVEILIFGLFILVSTACHAEDNEKYVQSLKEVVKITHGKPIIMEDIFSGRNFVSLKTILKEYKNKYFLVGGRTLQRVSERGGLIEYGPFTKPAYVEFPDKYKGYKVFCLAKLVGKYTYENEYGDEIITMHFKVRKAYDMLEFAYIYSYFQKAYFDRIDRLYPKVKTEPTKSDAAIFFGTAGSPDVKTEPTESTKGDTVQSNESPSRRGFAPASTIKSNNQTENSHLQITPSVENENKEKEKDNDLFE